jgi:two-component system, OmpR family, response regulator
MLPGEDGFSVCRRVRATSRIPIIMLTALGENANRIVGLNIGAHDYVTKPFNSRELIARIRAPRSISSRSVWPEARSTSPGSRSAAALGERADHPSRRKESR